MTDWHCDSNCKISVDGAGPWDDQYEYFTKIKQAHGNCLGFRTGERRLKGRKNWGHTEIEKMFTDCLILNYDKWLDAVTAVAKDPKIHLHQGGS